MLEELPKDMKGIATTPAADHLFKVNENPKYIDKDRASLFPHLVANVYSFANVCVQTYIPLWLSLRPGSNSQMKMAGENWVGWWNTYGRQYIWHSHYKSMIFESSNGSLMRATVSMVTSKATQADVLHLERGRLSRYKGNRSWIRKAHVKQKWSEWMMP